MGPAHEELEELEELMIQPEIGLLCSVGIEQNSGHLKCETKQPQLNKPHL